MSDALVIAVFQWLPLLILLVGAVLLLIHLGTYLRYAFGDGFAHLTYRGGFVAMALLQVALCVVAALWVPGFVEQHFQDHGLEALWSLPVMGPVLVPIIVASAVVLWGLALSKMRGRCLLIDGDDGTIRFYSLLRPLPAAPEAYLDMARPLKWDNELDGVDVFGIDTLQQTSTLQGYEEGDLPRLSVEQFIGRTNYFLFHHPRVSIPGNANK